MADARSGRAPRPAPRRARCSGWSRSITRMPQSLDRVLVHLDAEAGRSAARSSDRSSSASVGDIVGEQGRGRQPVGEPGRTDRGAAPARSRPRRRFRAGCRARWRGRRAAPRRSRSAARGPPTLASFRSPRRMRRARAPRWASATVATLSSATTGTSTSPHGPRRAPSSVAARLLDQLEPGSRVDRADPLDRPLARPRRRWRRSGSAPAAPAASRTARDPLDVRAVADLDLEGREARRATSRRLPSAATARARRRRLSRCRRRARGRRRRAARQAGSPSRLADRGRAARRRSAAASAGAGQPAAVERRGDRRSRGPRSSPISAGGAGHLHVGADRIERLAAPEAERDRVAPARSAVVGGEPDQQHLAALELPVAVT